MKELQLHAAMWLNHTNIMLKKRCKIQKNIVLYIGKIKVFRNANIGSKTEKKKRAGGKSKEMIQKFKIGQDSDLWHKGSALGRDPQAQGLLGVAKLSFFVWVLV